MLDDLEKPIFTQKQVLQMLPEMKPKTLQNWVERTRREVGDQKPGRAHKRLYTPIGVIVLAFMHKVVGYGIPPERASEMADHVAEAAIEFWQAGPEIIRTADGKSDWIPISPDRMKGYRRARIVTLDDDAGESAEGGRLTFLQFVESLDDPLERLRSEVSVVVEVDYIVAMTINRIFLLQAGVI